MTKNQENSMDSGWESVLVGGLTQLVGVISGVKQLRPRWYWLGAYRKSGLGGRF